METKFTSDGKKVVVVGKLNSTDHIVQEVFITADNVEIPSGENFVVKGLHDEPVISWKTKNHEYLQAQAKEWEDKYKREKEYYIKKSDENIEHFRKQTKILSDKLKFIVGGIKQADDHQVFDMVIGFIEGKYRYLVKNSYDPEIVLMTQTIENYEKSENWSGISLLTLFGQDDGGMHFKVGKYSDGSGNSTEVWPFETFEEAVIKLAEVINKGELNESKYKTALKYEIKINDDILLDYKARMMKSFLKGIEDAEKTLGSYKARLQEIEAL